MQKFHQISTDQYVPLSHDNSYLFNHYEKVHNFIKLKIDSQYKNILAKPIKHNYEVEWFSPFPDLRETTENQQLALHHYWDFQDKLSKQLDVLSNNKDEDKNNWISLLKTVFNPENNIIFNNDSDISIIWGWKFENNNIPKPLLADSTNLSNQFINEPSITEPDEDKNNADDNGRGIINVPEPEPKIEEEKEEFIFEDNFQKDNHEIEEEEEKGGFLEFLKEFAGKYWWLLVVLLSLIVLVYFIKTINY